VVAAFARRGGAPVCSLAAEVLGPVAALPRSLDDALAVA